MSDFAFALPCTLPHGFQCLSTGRRMHLSILNTGVPFSMQTRYRGPFIGIILSIKPNFDVLDSAIRRFGKSFSEGLRETPPTAGIILDTQREEYCVFRDLLGFIPIFVSYRHHERCCITTSPDIQAQFANLDHCRHSRLADYLHGTDVSPMHDDFFDNAERILPGENLFSTSSDPEEFLRRYLSGAEGNGGIKQDFRIGYWEHRHYCAFEASREDLTAELRQNLLAAANRIPSDNPCFAISGGLDSTGTMSAYLRRRGSPTIDAYSLISSAHPSCDESHELDILEDHFPLHLERICMDQSWTLSKPELYQRYSAFGPITSPGLEYAVSGYKAMQKRFGQRLIITGYGGNFIVKVRREAVFRHILTHLFSREAGTDFIRELNMMSISNIRTLIHRTAGNILGERINEAIYAIIGRSSKHCPVTAWETSSFLKAYPAPAVDCVFRMSQSEERAWMPQTWHWEMFMRAINVLMRITEQQIYDPLFDPVLYDFCAQIPPQMMMYRGEYRKMYKDALKPLLPKAILSHPKVQTFDDISHQGLANFAVPIIEERLRHRSGGWTDIIDADKFSSAYRRYVQTAISGGDSGSIWPLWHVLSLLFWDPLYA